MKWLTHIDLDIETAKVQVYVYRPLGNGEREFLSAGKDGAVTTTRLQEGWRGHPFLELPFEGDGGILDALLEGIVNFRPDKASEIFGKANMDRLNGELNAVRTSEAWLRQQVEKVVAAALK